MYSAKRLNNSVHAIEIIYSYSNNKLSASSFLSSEGVISKWLKRNGDSVIKDEVLCIVENDLSSCEIKAACSGILSIFKETQESILSNSVIGEIVILNTTSNLSPLTIPAPTHSLPDCAGLDDEKFFLFKNDPTNEDEISLLFAEKPKFEMLSHEDKSLIFTFWKHISHTESLFKLQTDSVYESQLGRKFIIPFWIFSSIFLLYGLFFNKFFMVLISIGLFFSTTAVKKFFLKFINKNEIEKHILQKYQQNILKASLNNFNNMYFESFIIPNVKRTVKYLISRKNGFQSEKSSPFTGRK
jgi:hypothetical protein